MHTMMPAGFHNGVTLFTNPSGNLYVDAPTFAKRLLPDTENPLQLILSTYFGHAGEFSKGCADMGKINQAAYLKIVGDPTQVDAAVEREALFFSIPWGVLKLCGILLLVSGFCVLEELLLMAEVCKKGLLPKPDPSLQNLFGIPKRTGARAAMRRVLADKEGVHPVTIWRREKKLEQGLPITRQHRLRSDHQEKYEQAKHLFYNKQMRAISRELDVPEATLYRWRRRAELEASL